tara:strand:- start:1529 stop:1717 length:189 start_codon:yes stop_codon:yes gene_type:complete
VDSDSIAAFLVGMEHDGLVVTDEPDGRFGLRISGDLFGSFDTPASAIEYIVFVLKSTPWIRQ